MNKIGTITVSVLQSEDKNTSFDVKTDNDNVEQVSYVIEDTLKKF